MQQQELQRSQGAAHVMIQSALTSTAPRYALKMDGRFRLTLVYTDVSIKMSLKRTSMPGGLIPTLHEQGKMVSVFAQQCKNAERCLPKHLPIHAGSDLVEQAFCILIFC